MSIKQSSLSFALRNYLNELLSNTRPNWPHYSSKDSVKARLIASAIQTLALRAGLLRLSVDEIDAQVDKIYDCLQDFALKHSPDQLHLVLNEPRSKGDPLSEWDYPDLEALAFPKVIQDQVRPIFNICR